MLKGHLAMLYNYTDKKCIKTCFLASVINFNCNKNNQMFMNEMLHQNQKGFLKQTDLIKEYFYFKMLTPSWCLIFSIQTREKAYFLISRLAARFRFPE